MKIGIIGAGNIGGTLGTRWATAGHDVTYGVRRADSDEVRDLIDRSGGRARASTIAEAVAASDVVVIAVPGPALRDVIAQASDWAGKIVIDVTNRFVPVSGGAGPSNSHEIARLAAGARVVKGFNTAGVETLADPLYGSEAADTFLCSDDAAAKTVVSALAAELGLDAVDAGPLANAALLESLTLLWIQLARTKGRGIAFKLLRRDMPPA
jgi:predicted dinucleotide-binding enzyme